MLLRFWNAIKVIFGYRTITKTVTVTEAETTTVVDIKEDTRLPNNWNKAFPISTGIAVPAVKQTFESVSIPDTVSKYRQAVYAYAKAWEYCQSGNIEQAKIYYAIVWEVCFPRVSRSGETGGIERRALGVGGSASLTTASSYDSYCNASQRDRKLGLGVYIAAHKGAKFSQDVDAAVVGSFSRGWEKLRKNAINGYVCPSKQVRKLGEACQDRHLVAYFCGIAARMLREEIYGRHRADNENTPLSNRKPVALTDSMDAADVKQPEPIDIIIDAEISKAIMNDIEAVLASKDQKVVMAWADRQANRRQGEHGTTRNEWWKTYGLGKNKAYELTNIVQADLVQRLDGYPEHLLGAVLKEAVDTIANG